VDCTPVVLAHEPPFRIGEAEFRPATREALRNGHSAVLEPRVMQLLVALRRAEGGVVTKDELVQLCWSGRVVGEDAINRVVSRLRSASEKMGKPFQVETITKVGYRLAPADGTPPAVAAAASTPARAVSRRRLLIGGSFAAAAIAAGGIGWKALTKDELPPEARALVEDADAAFKTNDLNDIANAVAQLRRAAELVPESPRVWGMMALGYMIQMVAAPRDARADLRERGLSAARRALALDPEQPDARAANIYTLPRFRNWLNHERQCRSAMRSQPRHLELNMLLAGTLAQVGRFAEILPMAENCIRQAPMHPGVNLGLAGTLYELGRFDEAEARLKRAFDLWPRKTGIWFSWFYFLIYNHRADEALTMVRNAAKRPLGIPDWNFDLAELQAEAIASRDPALLRRALQQWEEAAHTGTGFAENAVKFAAFTGASDIAFRIIDGLYFNRGFTMPDLRFSKAEGRYSGTERNTYLLFWRDTAPLRRDSRFAPLMRELGLVDYWQRSGSRPSLPL
jgi:DNA-binding winged helix-turn-helix (wHTH) protein/tetratricopeptide (TPR) repeat protein